MRELKKISELAEKLLLIALFSFFVPVY